MNKLKLLLLGFLLSLLPYTVTFSKKEPTKFDHYHSDFNYLLKTYVKNNEVDYKGFIKSKDLLNKYLNSLARISEKEYMLWNKNQKLAYWINAYNAFTIKAIIDNYPIKRSWTLIGLLYAPKNSILQIPGVWKKLEFKAMGKLVTLDTIEHQILRKDFYEPRIHMAINCASKSCPDLKSEAYTFVNLESQLEDASLKFINNYEKGLKLESNGKIIKISKILKWFGNDFDSYSKTVNISDNFKDKKGVLGFIYNYTNSEEIKNIIRSSNFELMYLEYDWTLNDKDTNF